jgi:hypothetical protein
MAAYITPLQTAVLVCIFCAGIIQMDDAEDNEPAVRTSGRSTLFCCLSCGIPFTFIDAAYTSEVKEVQDLMLFVHKIRREVRRNDHKTRALPSTQWQPNQSHYLHK